MSHTKSQISRIITRGSRARNSYRLLLREGCLTTRECCKIMHPHIANLQNPAAFFGSDRDLLFVDLSFFVLKLGLWPNLRSLRVA
jgi:hypothetical protein